MYYCWVGGCVVLFRLGWFELSFVGGSFIDGMDSWIDGLMDELIAWMMDGLLHE